MCQEVKFEGNGTGKDQQTKGRVKRLRIGKRKDNPCRRDDPERGIGTINYRPQARNHEQEIKNQTHENGPVNCAVGKSHRPLKGNPPRDHQKKRDRETAQLIGHRFGWLISVEITVRHGELSIEGGAVRNRWNHLATNKRDNSHSQQGKTNGNDPCEQERASQARGIGRPGGRR